MTDVSAPSRESRLLGYVSLFGSLGTLVCCGLPSLLVLVGLGATVASILSSLPWLVELSRQKVWVFGISGVLIAGNGYYLYRLVPRFARNREACPPGQEVCAEASRFSRALFVASVALYSVGFAVAFVLSPLIGMV